MAEKKGEPKLSPASHRDGRRLPLSGTNPDRYYISIPTASVVRPDLYAPAVLDSCIGIDADKRRHSHFDLKLRAINYLDQRLLRPIYEATLQMQEPIAIAVLPDHPTPVELRIHVSEPVPFLIYHPGIQPDEVQHYDEVACTAGAYGLLKPHEFMQTLMGI